MVLIALVCFPASFNKWPVAVMRFPVIHLLCFTWESLSNRNDKGEDSDDERRDNEDSNDKGEGNNDRGSGGGGDGCRAVKEPKR